MHAGQGRPRHLIQESHWMLRKQISTDTIPTRLKRTILIIQYWRQDRENTGGGRFGQSLTAIAKLAPDADMGEGLSVHYSGGTNLSEDIQDWLEINGINK